MFGGRASRPGRGAIRSALQFAAGAGKRGRGRAPTSPRAGVAGALGAHDGRGERARDPRTSLGGKDVDKTPQTAAGGHLATSGSETF